MIPTSNTLALIAVVGIASVSMPPHSTATAEEIKTQAGVAFFQPSDGGDRLSNATIGWKENGVVKWKASLGMASAVNIKADSSGRFIALLTGDKREGSRFPTRDGSENTLYVLEAKTGRTIKVINPLAGWEEAPWADGIWQNLKLSFSKNKLVVQGRVFSYPQHPNPIPFKKEIDLPQIAAPGAPQPPEVQEKPKRGIEF